MTEMPDFDNESPAKLRWFIEYFPSPHPFFKPAMTALEKKEAEAAKKQAGFHIHDSNIANINLGAQVGEIAAQINGSSTLDEFHDHVRQVVRIADLEWSLLNKPDKRIPPHMICKQVDDLRSALALLYGKCPKGVDGHRCVMR
jgi:hypothetical protein